MNIRELVEHLVSQGISYNEISYRLKITKSTVYWHASEKNRQYVRAKRNENKRKFKTNLKMKFGGKCSICGYSKCLDALDFHHIDPEIKDRRTRNFARGLGWIIHCMSNKIASEEASKCVLICANCHRETHSNILVCSSSG